MIIWEGTVIHVGEKTVSATGAPGSDPPSTTFDREEFGAARLKDLREGATIRWERGLRDEGGERQRYSVLRVEPPDADNL